MPNRSSSPARPAPPPAVRAGDRVSIVAPAGAVDACLLKQGCDVLASWGLVPVVHPQVELRQAYLAGSDRARAAGLVEAFLDPSTRVVVCARGGYGCARLLPLLACALKEGGREGECERGGWEGAGEKAELERGAEAVLGEGGATKEGGSDEGGGNEDMNTGAAGDEGKGGQGDADEGKGEAGGCAQRVEGRTGCGSADGDSGGAVMREREDAAEGRAEARGDVGGAGAGAAGGDGGCRGSDRSTGCSADVARCCSANVARCCTADVALGSSRRSRLATQVRRKRFFGFSDVTALHSFFQAELAEPIISFHAPMPATSFFTHQSALASRAALRAALFEPSLPLACPPLQVRVKCPLDKFQVPFRRVRAAASREGGWAAPALAAAQIECKGGFWAAICLFWLRSWGPNGRRGGEARAAAATAVVVGAGEAVMA
ncbi:unnamed protein product [Closterium sp. Naga37s-1]|nr:unnamed protein product [Closterium sp. Naga37s-1]